MIRYLKQVERSFSFDFAQDQDDIGEKGIAQLAVLFALIAAVGLGVYLTQQKTNLLPRAADNSLINCVPHPKDLVGVTTPSAKDPNLVNQADYQKEGANWDYVWEADCTRGCDDTSACTKNSASGAVNPETSRWCYEFKEGNRCMMLTTTDKDLGADNKQSGGQYGQGNATDRTKTASGSQPGDGAPVCKEAATTDYYDAKVANNLVRFYAIVEGIPEYCVPADLGVGDQEKADSKDGSIKGGRLLLCSGKAKDDGSQPDLVWRTAAQDGSNKLGEVDKTPPERSTLEQGFSKQVDEAKKAAGL